MWEPQKMYLVGERCTHDGIEYEIVCPRHDGATDCGGSFRSGFIAPPECLEDGFCFYRAIA